MPYSQIVEEHFSDNGCEDQIDREFLKLIAKDNNETEMTTRRGSESNQSDDEEFEYNPELNKILFEIDCY